MHTTIDGVTGARNRCGRRRNLVADAVVAEDVALSQ